VSEEESPIKKSGTKALNTPESGASEPQQGKILRKKGIINISFEQNRRVDTSSFSASPKMLEGGGFLGLILLCYS
jgi:hypothetical protein